MFFDWVGTLCVHSGRRNLQVYKTCLAFQWYGLGSRVLSRFLIKLGMKPCMHLVEISIFSLNNVTVRPTKIMNSADKNWAHFKKISYFKKEKFKKKY